ncbi:hypothetical protein [Streptomyces gardneri]|uniref:hypothetical protein n=1 Tax=Streptomyces gardneri TaxID=66892 RepID=UPI0033EFC014
MAGQVKEVRLWSTAPGAAAATSKAVQTYVYDDANRLRQAWNPQINPPLKTEYGYDAEGRVTTLAPPGELPWTFTYGKAGNAATAGDGMLLNASRSGLKQGTTDVQEGTATTSVVYDVPLTGAAAPYGMGAADVKTWGQFDAPTDATAVFPADAIPASASGTALNASDYQRADVHYLGASGRQVNSAAPGGHIDTTEFDRRIPSEVVDGLRAAALLEGCRLVVPGAWHTDTVMGLVHTAELFEAADEAVRAEIAAWTRTGAVGEGPATEGVPAYAFGPRQYDVTSPARDFDAPRQVPGRVSARFEKNPQIALLGTADDTPEQWLKAGQAMQRVLLQATLDGLSTSLMSQPLEWPELRSDARDPSSKVGFVHMVFRLGYGPQGRATPRRPVSEVLSFD